MCRSLKFVLVCLLVLKFNSNVALSDKVERQFIKLYQCAHDPSKAPIENINMPSHLMTTNRSAIFGVQTSCLPRHPNCHATTKCSTETLKISVPHDYTALLKLNSSDDSVHFTKRGFLKITNEYFNRNEYCIDGMNKTHLDVSVCLADCRSTKLCIPKCCTIEKVLNIESGACQFTTGNEYWKPLVYQSEDVQICGEKKTNLRLHYKQHIPQCEQYITYTLETYPELEHRIRFRLLRNGSVILRELQSPEWKILNEGTFCLDGIQRSVDGKIVEQVRNDQILISCFPKDLEVEGLNVTVSQDNISKLTFTGVLYIFLLFSGVPFLLLTVIVYLLLWKKQNEKLWLFCAVIRISIIHGWTLFSHNLAMLFNYFCQGLTNAVSRIYNSEDNASFSCRLIGVANHFFVLSSFCWLLMINLDLYLTFRHLQNTVGQSKGMKRFLLYSLFAWGLPLLAVIIGVTLDSKYGLHGHDADCEVEVVVPLYGHRSCYIVEEARSYYLYYPISVLMAINLTFAMITIYHMYQHTQSTKTTLLDSSTKHRQSFKVLAKLFVVMGLVFLLEIVVWKLRTKDDTLPWYLIFPDVLNLFQAIAVFLLFTCKSKILDQLCDLYPSLTPFLKKIKLWRCYNKKEKDSSVKVSVVSDSAGKKVINGGLQSA